MKRNQRTTDRSSSTSKKQNSATGTAGLLRSPAIRHVLVAAAIILVAFIAYSNSFRAPFLLDNEEIVLKDQRVHAFTPIQFHRILAGE